MEELECVYSMSYPKRSNKCLNINIEKLDGELQMAVLTYFALLGGAFGLAMALMFGLRAAKLI